MTAPPLPPSPLPLTYIGDQGVEILCQGLSQNSSLTSLDLPGNLITDLGATYLADALQKHATLTQLNLPYNNIADDGATALATVRACVFGGGEGSGERGWLPGCLPLPYLPASDLPVCLPVYPSALPAPAPW